MSFRLRQERGTSWTVCGGERGLFGLETARYNHRTRSRRRWPMRFHASVLAAAMPLPVLPASAPATAQPTMGPQAARHPGGLAKRALDPGAPSSPLITTGAQPAVELIDAKQFFAGAAVLGDAWSRAVGAV